ncbi:nascent polypeptide-associated complex protein [mine drainage metagenome]|uniref:Nascent polypeptide-associated complex protein n=1 Tax=mine drainage metagenome TaxID=410659 RepID=T0YA14_9ZZZZ
MPGKMNSREMRRMMSQMGIKSTEMNDVKRVIMEGELKNYIVENPQVVLIEGQGQKSLQIIGIIKEVQKGQNTVKKAETTLSFPNEDIELVMSQANVTKEKAIDALKKASGEPAQAIIDLSQ